MGMWASVRTLASHRREAAEAKRSEEVKKTVSEEMRKRGRNQDKTGRGDDRSDGQGNWR